MGNPFAGYLSNLASVVFGGYTCPDTPLLDMNTNRLARKDVQAAAIVETAQETVRNILEGRQNMDNNGNQNAPLVVTLGENHDSISNMLHQMLVIKGLQESGRRIIVGLEKSEDEIRNELCDQQTQRTPEQFKQHFDAYNSQGILANRKHFSDFTSRKAPYSKKILSNFLLQDSSPPAYFTDCASIIETQKHPNGELRKFGGDNIDPDEGKTPQSIAAARERNPDYDDIDAAEIDFKSPFGMSVRNHHIAATLMGRMEQNGAEIGLQLLGNAHIIGLNDFILAFDRPKPEESVTEWAKQMGAAVLAIPVISGGFDYSLPHPMEIPPNTPILLVEDPVNKTFIFDEHPETKEIFSSPEKEWLDQRLEAMGLSHIKIDDWPTVMAQNNDRISEILDQEQTRPAPDVL